MAAAPCLGRSRWRDVGNEGTVAGSVTRSRCPVCVEALVACVSLVVVPGGLVCVVDFVRRVVVRVRGSLGSAGAGSLSLGPGRGCFASEVGRQDEEAAILLGAHVRLSLVGIGEACGVMLAIRGRLAVVGCGLVTSPRGLGSRVKGPCCLRLRLSSCGVAAHVGLRPCGRVTLRCVVVAVSG